MGKAEQAREGSAVLRDGKPCSSEQRRLDRRQQRILALKLRDERHQALGLRLPAVHAAFRARKETMTDFEVGVSLSAPALLIGTTTFSSG